MDEPTIIKLGEDLISSSRMFRSLDKADDSVFEKKIFSGSSIVSPVYFEYRGDTSNGNFENWDIAFFRLFDIHSGSPSPPGNISLKLSFEIKDKGIIYGKSLFYRPYLKREKREKGTVNLLSLPFPSSPFGSVLQHIPLEVLL